jgi:hypothetical protein
VVRFKVYKSTLIADIAMIKNRNLLFGMYCALMISGFASANTSNSTANRAGVVADKSITSAQITEMLNATIYSHSDFPASNANLLTRSQALRACDGTLNDKGMGSISNFAVGAVATPDFQAKIQGAVDTPIKYWTACLQSYAPFVTSQPATDLDCAGVLNQIWGSYCINDLAGGFAGDTQVVSHDGARQHAEYQGLANYTCQNGRWKFNDGTCVSEPDPCARGESVSWPVTSPDWAVVGNTTDPRYSPKAACTATTDTVNLSSTLVGLGDIVDPSVAPAIIAAPSKWIRYDVGAMGGLNNFRNYDEITSSMATQFRCFDGDYVLEPSSQCVYIPPSCEAQTYTTSDGCTFNLPDIPHETQVTVQDVLPFNSVGQVTAYCFDGQIEILSESCELSCGIDFPARGWASEDPYNPNGEQCTYLPKVDNVNRIAPNDTYTIVNENLSLIGETTWECRDGFWINPASNTEYVTGESCRPLDCEVVGTTCHPLDTGCAANAHTLNYTGQDSNYGGTKVCAHEENYDIIPHGDEIQLSTTTLGHMGYASYRCEYGETQFIGGQSYCSLVDDAFQTCVGDVDQDHEDLAELNFEIPSWNGTGSCVATCQYTDGLSDIACLDTCSDVCDCKGPCGVGGDKYGQDVTTGTCFYQEQCSFDVKLLCPAQSNIVRQELTCSGGAWQRLAPADEHCIPPDTNAILDPPLVNIPVLPAGGCIDTILNWDNGVGYCQSLSGSGSHNQVKGLGDNNANATENGTPSTGTANFRCVAGSWYQEAGANCTPPPADCSARSGGTAQNEAISGNSCNYAIPQTSNGAKAIGTDSNYNPHAGGARFTCDGFTNTFILDSTIDAGWGGNSCGFGSCADATVTWGACSGTVGRVSTQAEGQFIVSDISGSPVGDAVASCDESTGVVSVTGATNCGAKCPIVGDITWAIGANTCKIAMADYAITGLPNEIVDFTDADSTIDFSAGENSYFCDGATGNWAPSGLMADGSTVTTPSCAYATVLSDCDGESPAASAGVLPYGTNCSVTIPVGATPHNDTLVLANMAAGYTGTASVTCADDVWVVDPASTCESASTPLCMIAPKFAIFDAANNLPAVLNVGETQTFTMKDYDNNSVIEIDDFHTLVSGVPNVPTLSYVTGGGNVTYTCEGSSACVWGAGTQTGGTFCETDDVGIFDNVETGNDVGPQTNNYTNCVNNACGGGGAVWSCTNYQQTCDVETACTGGAIGWGDAGTWGAVVTDNISSEEMCASSTIGEEKAGDCKVGEGNSFIVRTKPNDSCSCATSTACFGGHGEYSQACTGSGADLCTAPIPAGNYSNGAASGVIIDNLTEYTGSASFTCNGTTGAWTPNAGSSCDTGCTSGQAVAWLVGADTCTGIVPGSGNFTEGYTTPTFFDTDGSVQGSANFSCTGGTWVVTGSPTCGTTAASCSGGTQTWQEGGAAGGTWLAPVLIGNSQEDTCQAEAFADEKSGACSAGDVNTYVVKEKQNSGCSCPSPYMVCYMDWTNYRQDCDVAAAQTCQADIVSGSHADGSTRSAVDSNTSTSSGDADSQGDASYICNDGAWELQSGATCSTAPVTGANCDGGTATGGIYDITDGTVALFYHSQYDPMTETPACKFRTCDDGALVGAFSSYNILCDTGGSSCAAFSDAGSESTQGDCNNAFDGLRNLCQAEGCSVVDNRAGGSCVGSGSVGRAYDLSCVDAPAVNCPSWGGGDTEQNNGDCNSAYNDRRSVCISKGCTATNPTNSCSGGGSADETWNVTCV